ncbi:hypothetical protein DI383_14025 [Flavobacteriaceae bacterium LYZ1037]|nr:hypothetical protein DI383_14025 [Flavobacteriaceae bacterium LYZ1037]
MRTQIVLLLLLICHFSGFSQVTFSGVVKDSLQKPLPYANVIAQPQDSLKRMKFSITDEQGRYRLELENVAYQVTVSYMGYASYHFEIDTKENTIRNIILKEQDNRLDEVVIELPITVKQDTIIYHTDKFVTGDERKLKNVLKKLPGVEVEKNGTVTVNGKKVTTMLVEGKKFFGGGSKLAVDNIPANAIDKIEVLDNYNEVAFLKNLVENEEMAMNVLLKEDKKDFAFGDIEAGKGNQDFYRAHNNLFYYSPKTNINFIGNLNNTAEKVLTYKDYFEFQGGLNEAFKNGSTVFNTINNDFLQLLENKNVIKSQNQFAAINISQEINNKLNVQGYGIFSNTKDETYNQSLNQYNTFNELKDELGQAQSTFAIGNLNFKYLPNLREQWDFKTQFKKSHAENENIINSLVDTTNSRYLTLQNMDVSFFSQNIEWHKKASKNHTFSFAADFVFDKNNPNSFWETPDPILEGLIPVVEEPIYRLNQIMETKNTNFNVYFKHYWVLNRFNHIYSSIANTYLNQKFYTNDSQELLDGTINDFSSSGFGNDLVFNLNDFFFGIHYKFRAGIFTFNQGAFLHIYHWKLDQQTNIVKNKVVLLPSFLAKIDITNSKRLQFNYNLKTSFSDASTFANRFNLQSYNSVFKGNENLENELYHVFRLGYRRLGNFRGISVYANASYTKKLHGAENTVNYQDTNQYVSVMMLDNPTESWQVRGHIQKKIKKINFGLGLNYNGSKYLQQIDNTFETNENNQASINVSAKTLYTNFPTIEVGYKSSIGNYTSSNIKSEFVTNEPFLNIDYDFLKGFIFSFDYSMYNYKNKFFNQNNTYDIVNTSLYYKHENSAWSFKLEARNVFDVAFRRQNSFSSYIISDTKTYILPRIIMFSVGYNL